MMNVFNLKIFFPGKPIELGQRDTLDVYRPKTRYLYRPDSTILESPHRLLPSNKTRLGMRREDIRAGPQAIVGRSELEKQPGTIQLNAYNLSARKKKITWDPVDGSDVANYKLYWAVGGGVDYDSDCAEVGNVAEVMLPDDIPSFPHVADDVEIGVTAVSHKGNESDMSVFSAPFDFTAPPAPQNLMVADV
jgi:hypothetical protein